MRKPVLLALSLALAAGCSTLKAENAAPALAGTSWTFTTIDGVAPVGRRASLVLQADRLGANVGCNGMGSTWRQEGNRLMVEGVISTMMYCEGVMDQERAVSDLLGASPEFTITEGTMTLTGGGHRATLQRN